jgi:predicted AAA+ superfamily ATPase
VNTYIEKTQQETVDPVEVRRQYFAAVKAVEDAENHLKELLRREGLIIE